MNKKTEIIQAWRVVNEHGTSAYVVMRKDGTVWVALNKDDSEWTQAHIPPFPWVTQP
jgi:hypothetical protein